MSYSWYTLYKQRNASTYVWKFFHFEQLYEKAAIGQQFLSDTFYSPSNNHDHAWRIILEPKTTRATNAVGFFLDVVKTVDEQKNNLETRKVVFQFTVYRLDPPIVPESIEKRWSLLVQKSCTKSFDSKVKNWGFPDALQVASIWPNNDQTAEVDLMVKVDVWEES